MVHDLLRIIDTIHKQKNIDKEIVFQGLEQALEAAAKKRAPDPDLVTVTIDRESGEITALDDGEPIDPVDLGRIAALTAKQVMIQRFREAERDVVFDEYEERKGELVTGVVQRYDRPNAIISHGKAEFLLPGREQPPGESYHVGERLKVLILEVRKVGQRVRIIASRTHADIVKALFAAEVPEIQENLIEIKAIARDPGYRTKVAVISHDTKVDPVGACVGMRGSRIRTIVEELNGEKIDIVRYNESPEVFILNALKPAEIQGIELVYDEGKALVFVSDDQLSLAIGKRGQNVRLASRITGWAIDIVTGSPDNFIEKFVTSRPLEEVQAEREAAAKRARAALDGVTLPVEETVKSSKPDPFAKLQKPAAEGGEAKTEGEGEVAERPTASAAEDKLSALMSKQPSAAPAPWLDETKSNDKSSEEE
ncbi:MAG: transcription termination factor NusA [Planctomycetota bacterium]